MDVNKIGMRHGLIEHRKIISSCHSRSRYEISEFMPNNWLLRSICNKSIYVRLKLYFTLCVLLFIFVCRVSAGECYPRHYFILVDQTKDLQFDDNATFEKVYSYLKANLAVVGYSSFVFHQ